MNKLQLCWFESGSLNLEAKLMLKFLICCFMLVTTTLHATLSQAQVTSNVLTRVLMIRVGNNTGTSFTMEVDGRQYLITAKHMVAGLKPEDSIEIFKADQWSPINVKVFRCDDPIDIAVLVPPVPLTPTFTLEPRTDRFFFGQDAYFAGFPYGISMSGKNVNGLYLFPLIKKGTISAQVEDKGATVILLDGHNNRGFSGGPIVYRDLNQSKVVFYLAGVIAGFIPELVPVTKPEKIKPGQDVTQIEQWRIVKLKDGQMFELKDTDQKVPLNTGIVIGYHIQHAIDLIQKNPIGPKTVE